MLRRTWPLSLSTWSPAGYQTRIPFAGYTNHILLANHFGEFYRIMYGGGEANSDVYIASPSIAAGLNPRHFVLMLYRSDQHPFSAPSIAQKCRSFLAPRFIIWYTIQCNSPTISDPYKVSCYIYFQNISLMPDRSTCIAAILASNTVCFKRLYSA